MIIKINDLIDKAKVSVLFRKRNDSKWHILVHQRGSMTHKFRVDPLSKHFYDSVEEFLGFPNWVSRPGFVDVFNGTVRRYFRPFKNMLK